MNTAALDFVVINVTTSNPVASFMLPTDALAFIKARRAAVKAPNVSSLFDIENADGSPLSAELCEAVERANGCAEHSAHDVAAARTAHTLALEAAFRE